ncbi:MAG: hypothetical protein Q9170_001516 [Blastenia crenularia]
MFKGRSRGLGRARAGAATVQKVPLRGIFSGNIWYCNCTPRLPAQRFQTKNGGKNHGRWSQPKRCDFFLWDDDAKPREAAAVLSNSRTEPRPAPQTPTKPSNTLNAFGLQTPYTDSVKSCRAPELPTPKTPSKPLSAPRNAGDTQHTSTTVSTLDDEFYDWPASDDEDVFKVADEASAIKNMPPPETPSKAAKTNVLSSPGKRRFSQIDDEKATNWPTPSSSTDDVFVTPNTGVKRDGLFSSSQETFSLFDTPTPRRFKDALHSSQDPELTSEVMTILQEAKTSISSPVKDQIKAVCEKHTMSTRGILKGRDISRTMVNTKNAKISELQETIAVLQAERETNRAVIRHLRRDMRTMKS